jgi:hypothetical protein
MLGGGVGCSTCCFDLAEVVQLIGDSIAFGYPAFEYPEKFSGTMENGKTIWEDSEPDSEDENNKPDLTSCFTLDSRCGSVTEFDYDLKTQTLSYDYMPDDLTPVQSMETYDEQNAPHFAGRFRFNGQQFVHQSR